MSVNAELKLARTINEAHLRRELARSGVRQQGPAAEWFIRLLRHRLGDLDGRGNPVQYPTTPAGLTEYETRFVEQAVARALDAFPGRQAQVANTAKAGTPTPRPPRPRPAGWNNNA